MRLPHRARLEGIFRRQQSPAIRGEPVNDLDQLSGSADHGAELGVPIAIWERRAHGNREPRPGAVHRVDGEHGDGVGALLRWAPVQRVGRESRDRIAEPIDGLLDDLTSGAERGVGHPGSVRTERLRLCVPSWLQMDGRFYLGTSGFAYDEWRHGIFYPEGLKKDDMLDYYSSQLSSVEVNYTFRRLPSEKTIERWRERARPGFVFTL